MTRESPFAADPALETRLGAIVADLGPTFAARLAAALDAAGRDPVHPSAVIPAAAAAWLLRDLGLEGTEEVMLLALETARTLARAPVSGYRVGAVGLAARSGDLILGANLELPGASIWQTVHGEGFVTLLARARRERVVTLALAEARPCAHCRQVLAEIDGAHASDDEGGLRLIDPGGHALRLADLYPAPFLPGTLGMTALRPAEGARPGLALADAALPPDVEVALVEAGARSHAPYSGSPAAVVLRVRDGGLVAGSVLENVAFNPTIGPAQDALVGLLASGHDLPDIAGTWLAVPRDAPFGHETMTRDALSAAAPGIALHVTYWS